MSDVFAPESAIGMALDRNSAEVQARSNLGQVTLYGTAASPRQAEDIVRAVAKVSGVRQVKSLLAVGAAAVRSG